MAEVRTPITDPQRLKALAHPFRWKLIRLLGTEDTATATRCSEVLGESVASCSYHLNMLAKYGFIEEATGGQGREKPWQLTSRSQTLSTEGLDDETKLAVEAAGEAFLETEFAEIRARVRTEDTEPKEWRDYIGIHGNTLWVTPAEATELLAEIERLVDRYRDREEKPELRPDGARLARLFLASYVTPQHPAG
jgi:predicted ArsR family transcriptional regulator